MSLLVEPSHNDVQDRAKENAKVLHYISGSTYEDKIILKDSADRKSSRVET